MKNELKTVFAIVIGAFIFMVGCFWIIEVFVSDSNKPYHLYRVDYTDGKHDTIKAQKFTYYFDKKYVELKPWKGVVTNVENIVCIDDK